MSSEATRFGGAAAHHLRSVRRLTQAVCGGQPAEHLFDLALDCLLASTDADRASVLLYDASGVMRFRAWRGLDEAYRSAVEGHSPWTAESVEPAPILVEDIETDPDCAPYLPIFREHDIAALAFVPLYCERLLGKFMLYFRAPHRFADAEVQLASIVADQVAVAVHNEVMARRMQAANDHLDSILRHVGEGITVQDRSGRLLYVNDAAARMIRVDSRDRLLATSGGEMLSNFRILDPAGAPLPEDDLPGRVALRTGDRASAIVQFTDAHTNETRWSAITASVVPGADGEPALAVNVFRDITELHRAQEQLEENQRQLRDALEKAQDAERRKDEFLAVLGHELRNPLAPIVTALQIMEMKEGEDCIRERKLIERHVSHLRRLVDDLLDISRITRGKIELQLRRIELSEIVAQAVELVSPLLEQRGHGLSIDLPIEGLPVLADPTRLTQVVVNLLSNAARYTDPGGHVLISAVGADDQIILRVRDDGIGISADVLPELFDVFVQGSRSVEHSRGGLGLGLTIVRRLVELHGGQVTVSSDGPGEGSEFVVRLPFARDDDAAALADRSRTPEAAGARALRILVVDDNVDAAETLADALDLLGHLPATAHDGPAALQLAAQREFDVAVLDIGLPVMDGYELARRLQQDHPQLRLVAVTGYGQPHDRQRSTDAGFERHLVKPVDLDELLAAIVG